MYFFYKPKIVFAITSVNINLLKKCKSIQDENYTWSNYISNDYLSIPERNEILEIITKNRKLKCILQKFIYKLRSKIIKKKPIINEYDLYYNSFDDYKGNVLYLYHNNNNWKFTKEDIVNSIANNLTNVVDLLYLKSHYPKNPYNAIEFKIEHLATIYNYLKTESQTTNSNIIQLFRNSNNSIELFQNLHFNYLNNIIIDTRIYNCNDGELVLILKDFIKIYFIRYKIINFNYILENINNFKFIIINLIKKIGKFNNLSTNDKKELILDFIYDYPDIKDNKRFRSSTTYNINNINDVVNTINTENLDNANVSENLDNTNVSENLNNANVSENLDNTNVLENLDNANVSENLNNANVSENLNNANVSENLDNSNVSENSVNNNIINFNQNYSSSNILFFNNINELLNHFNNYLGNINNTNYNYNNNTNYNNNNTNYNNNNNTDTDNNNNN